MKPHVKFHGGGPIPQQPRPPDALVTTEDDGRRTVASCYHCRTRFFEVTAERGVVVSNALAPRLEPHDATGLPRFGPSVSPRATGWRPLSRATFALVYVNCPQCDRGQIARLAGS